MPKTIISLTSSEPEKQTLEAKYGIKTPEGKLLMAKKKKTSDAQQPTKQFTLKKIVPLTRNQQRAFDEYESGKHLVLHGFAGTGKTYIATYLGLREILLGSSFYDRIAIVRSVVPSRDIGYLPGGVPEKSKMYEEPYKDICDELFARGDGYEVLKQKELVEFITTSFLRGVTFNNTIMIVDEINNMTFQELDTIMTRIGENTRVVFCGDYRQSDLEKKGDREGLKHFLKILDKIPDVAHIEFTEQDIVRSGIVKDYIIARTEFENVEHYNKVQG